MDIYAYLKKDHDLVADLMEQLLDATQLDQRKKLFERIKQELTLHADTEEATFYKAIEDKTRSKQVEKKLDHADEEHNEIRTYLETLSSLPMDSEEWMEQFGEFKHAVTHHVEEEEGEIFEKAKTYLSKEDAVKLAREMEALKQRALKQYAAA